MDLAKNRSPASTKLRAFGGSFILALVMSANLAMFFADPKTTMRAGNERPER